MQFFSGDGAINGVTVEPTKSAICEWWDNNDAGVDSPALDPNKMVVEPLGNGHFKISYWFSGQRATELGYTDAEPL